MLISSVILMGKNPYRAKDNGSYLTATTVDRDRSCLARCRSFCLRKGKESRENGSTWERGR